MTTLEEGNYVQVLDDITGDRVLILKPNDVPVIPDPPSRGHAYLDDDLGQYLTANQPITDAYRFDQVAYPRIAFTENNAYKGTDIDAVCNVVTNQAFSYDKMFELAQKFPHMKYGPHISFRGYQGWAVDRALQGQGWAWVSAGPATVGTAQIPEVNITHFTYGSPCQLTAQLVGGLNRTARVDNKSLIESGFLHVFSADEHGVEDGEICLIKGLDGTQITVGNRTIDNRTIPGRQYGGTGEANQVWPIGTWVRSMKRAADQGNPENLQFNLCDQIETADQNDVMGWQAWFNWMLDNFDRDKNGNVIQGFAEGAVCLFTDVDLLAFQSKINADSNLKGTTLNGWHGQLNTYEQGVIKIRQGLHDAHPRLIFPAGSEGVIGYKAVGGNQHEEMAGGDGQFGDASTDHDIDFHIQTLDSHNLMSEQQPAFVSVVDKRGMKSEINPTNILSNWYAFGASQLVGTFYGQQSRSEVEGRERSLLPMFAVNNGKNDLNAYQYGECVFPLDGRGTPIADSVKGLGWLGNPLDGKYRLYDEEEFTLDKAVYNLDFTDPSTVITGVGIDWERTADGVRMINWTPGDEAMDSWSDAKFLTQALDFDAGDYVIVYEMMAPEPRQLKVGINGNDDRQKQGVGNVFHPIVINTSVDAGETSKLIVECGQQRYGFTLRSIKVFRGRLRSYRRDYDNGIIVVNAPGSRISEFELHENFQNLFLQGPDARLHDPRNVLNRSVVDRITLDKKGDSRFLIRVKA